MKTNNFWLNLEKPCFSQGLIRTLVINKNEINDPIETNTEFQDFYKTLFIDNLSISKKKKKKKKKRKKKKVFVLKKKKKKKKKDKEKKKWFLF